MLKEIEEAKKRPITYDEDCPELSPAQLKQLKCMVRMRNRLVNGIMHDTIYGEDGNMNCGK
jgi:hypothetical protein